VLMVGMEGSAVLAVRKVVVVARAAEREVAEGAGAGSARVACVDGGSAGCGRAGYGRAGCGRAGYGCAGCGRVLRRRLAAAARGSSGRIRPCVWASFPIPGVNVNTTDATSLDAGCERAHPIVLYMYSTVNFPARKPTSRYQGGVQETKALASVRLLFRKSCFVTVPRPAPRSNRDTVSKHKGWLRTPRSTQILSTPFPPQGSRPGARYVPN
jgi:hypothetical protein